MRVLLDECVPRALREHLPGHEVKTVVECLGARIAVVVVHASSNDIAVLQPMMANVLEALARAPRGKVTNVR